MNQVIKIIGYCVFLFVLYIGTITTLKSCKSADKNETTIVEETYEADGEIYDEYFESDEQVKEDVVPTEDVEYADEEYDEEFSFEATEAEKKKMSEPAKVKAPAPKPAPVKRTTTAQSQDYSSSLDGKYLVVAGSYLIRDNAEKMITKLKKLGFSGAEIVKFDDSKYHSITAGRYNDYDNATSTANALKRKGIDCYVHTRK